MSRVKNESYREIPFSRGTQYNEFYIYIDLREIPEKCANSLDTIIKCRTIGILQSFNGRFYISDLTTTESNPRSVQVSMVYIESPTPSTVIPYPVQIFGTLQWKNRPVIFAKILQVLNVPTAIRLKRALDGITSIHLATNKPQDHEETEDPT